MFSHYSQHRPLPRRRVQRILSVERIAEQKSNSQMLHKDIRNRSIYLIL